MRVGHESGTLLGTLQDDLNPQVGSHALSDEDRAGDQVAQKGRGRAHRPLSGDAPANRLRGAQGDHTKGAILRQGTDNTVGL